VRARGRQLDTGGDIQFELDVITGHHNGSRYCRYRVYRYTYAQHSFPPKETGSHKLIVICHMDSADKRVPGLR
jgi:hypothetical protein